MKTLTATLDPSLSAKDLARVCQIYHKEGHNLCPMGWFFKCPLRQQKPCEDVTAKDWEAIMQDENVLEVEKGRGGVFGRADG